MTVRLMDNGQQISQCKNYHYLDQCIGDFVVDSKRVKASTKKSSGACYFNFNSYDINYFYDSKIYIIYSVIYTILLTLQGVVCYFIFKGLKNLTIHERSISIITAMVVYIISINRMVKTVHYLWEGVKILLFRKDTIIYLLLLLVLVKL